MLLNLTAYCDEPKRSKLELIQQTWAQILFLPAYSPDLNPEKMWRKLKEFVRRKEARSLPTLIGGHSPGFGSASQQEDAMNWFASCGYTFI